MKAFPSLYFATLFMVTAAALLTTYLALYLSHNDISSTTIGLMTSTYYVGLMCGSKVGHWLVVRSGHIRAFATSTAIVSACAAAHALSDSTVFWLLLRFIVGVFMMCNFMVLESWLNDQTEPEKRGNVFAFYMLMSYLGMITGQLALSFFPDLGIQPLILVSILYSICVIPLAQTQRIHPAPLKPTKLNVLHYWQRAPQAMITALFTGIISGCFLGLAPVFIASNGLSAEHVSTFMATTIFAGLLAQWPMGKLSDKYPRSVLIRINITVICITAILMFTLPFHYTIALALTFVFGFTTLTLYPLAAALANSRVSQHERIALSATLLMTFGLGASTGPLMAAQLMDVWSEGVMYAYIAIMGVVTFTLLTIINLVQKAEKPMPEDYVATSGDIVSSPLAAAFDPRVDQDIAQQQLSAEHTDTTPEKTAEKNL